MALLLDAHSLIWWLADDRRLSAAARESIATADRPLVGAGTLVEIAVKRSLGKLEIADDWTEQTQADGFSILPISLPHVARLQALAYPSVAGRVHRDPFDRLLAAQALNDGIAIVTCDAALSAYGASVVW